MVDLERSFGARRGPETMTLTPILAWLCLLSPRLRWRTARVKAMASFTLVWAVQVTLALLLLPVLVFVLAVGGMGILIVWLTGTGRRSSSAQDHTHDA